jgi:hypothetical protein
MADQKVNIDIRTKGAKKAKDELGGLSGSISKMGKAVGIASAAYFGARGLINAFSSTIELAGIQEQAEKQLETALGRTSQSLLDQASALQKVTTFGDEATIQQQAFLASLGFTEDKIIEIIPVAMDLATATGMTLESAVRNTAKTFSGLAGELGEMVPQLRDLTAEEMKAGDAVRIMADLFGGQATAQAETMSGALEQAQNSAGDLAEAIGERLSPLVKVLATNFGKGAEELTKLISGGEDTEFIGVPLSESMIAMKEFRDSISNLNVEQLLFEQEKIGGLLGKAFLDEEKASLYNAQLIAVRQTLIPLIDDIKRTSDAELDLGENIEKVNTDHVNHLINVSDLKEKQMKQDLKAAALSGQSAKEAMKSVVRAETMEAVAGYIASVLKSVPFPANLVLAAGGGAVASGLIDRGLAAFADGGIVQGDPSKGDAVPALLTAGELILNASQQQGLLNNMGGVTVNIQGNMIGNEEFVRDTLIPEIDKTVNRGLA